jgi:hypothetical protein
MPPEDRASLLARLLAYALALVLTCLPPSMDAAPLTAFLKLAGETPRDFFGFSVAGVGDANGDGYGDLVVGAPWNGTFGPRAGRAYLHFGGAAMDSIGDLAFFTAPTWTPRQIRRFGVLKILWNLDPQSHPRAI